MCDPCENSPDSCVDAGFVCGDTTFVCECPDDEVQISDACCKYAFQLSLKDYCKYPDLPPLLSNRSGQLNTTQLVIIILSQFT